MTANRDTTHDTPAALRITGGRVIDPANGVDRVRDVLIHEHRIVDSLPTRVTPRTIDATGQLVMPGAIDMHTHVASRGVAIAHEIDPQLVPTPADTARAYLRQGYTTIIDPAVPPEDTDFAHDRLDHMIGLDAGFLLELGTHDEVIDALAHHSEHEAIARIDRLVTDSGAFGIKLVNPRHPAGLDATLNGTDITSRRLIRFTAEAAEHLPVVHPVHLHVPELGAADSVHHTIDALESLQGHRAHLAHAQFYAYARDENGRLASGAPTLCDYLQQAAHLTTDAGCIALGPAMMITRDHPLGRRLAQMTGSELTVRDQWSVMPMRYDGANAINAVQWAIGLELILRCDDLSRITLSVDHPNGGPFTAMPALLALLADHAARRAALDDMHDAATQRTGLASLTRELTEAELVTLTRAAPARALGLTDRGHLAPGAQADVVLAPRVPAPPTTVLHAGRIVLQHGAVHPTTPGQRLRATPTAG